MGRSSMRYGVVPGGWWQLRNKSGSGKSQVVELFQLLRDLTVNRFPAPRNRITFVLKDCQARINRCHGMPFRAWSLCLWRILIFRFTPNTLNPFKHYAFPVVDWIFLIPCFRYFPVLTIVDTMAGICCIHAKCYPDFTKYWWRCQKNCID